MIRKIFILIVIISVGCKPENAGKKAGDTDKIKTATLKPIKQGLPIIGLLVFDGVLTTEVTAPLF